MHLSTYLMTLPMTQQKNNNDQKMWQETFSPCKARQYSWCYGIQKGLERDFYLNLFKNLIYISACNFFGSIYKGLCKHLHRCVLKYVGETCFHIFYGFGLLRLGRALLMGNPVIYNYQGVQMGLFLRYAVWSLKYINLLSHRL